MNVKPKCSSRNCFLSPVIFSRLVWELLYSSCSATITFLINKNFPNLEIYSLTVVKNFLKKQQQSTRKC